MNTNYEHFLLTQVLQSIIDCKKLYWCDGWVPAAVLLGGDQPWLRRLLGISMAPQVGSIFNQAVRDNMAKRWNGVAARRTTESDTTNHRRYRVTGKSLDAARCTGGPLLVIARNWVFLCILHCCMAMGRLFVACGLPGGPVGKSSPSGRRGGTKNSVLEPVWGAVGGAQRTGRGGGPQPVLGLGTDCAPACICRGGPHVAIGCGPPQPLSFITLRPSMDAAELRKLLEEIQKATLALVVCCLSAVVCVHIAFIIRRS